jgi:F5/8 type C domain
VLAGIGLWANQLFAVYLVPFGVLALRTGLAARPGAALFGAGVVLGALPAWLHELQQFPSTRFALHGVGAGQTTTLLERLTRVVPGYGAALLGLHAEEGRPFVTATPVVLVAVAAAAAVLVRAAIRDGPELRWALGLGGRRQGGASLLWWVFAANLALLLLTQRGGMAGSRYAFPLWSVLPCWIGAALFGLWLRRRALGGAALGTLLAAQLWANWVDTVGSTPPGDARWRYVETRIGPVLRWLEQRGARRVYWGEDHGFQSYPVPYFTRQRIVAADPWREPALPHAQLVDAAVSPAFVMRADEEADSLVESLRGIGWDARQTPIGATRVIEPIRAVTTGFRPIPADRWAITASVNAELAPNLLDRDASTGWNSGKTQAPGQSLTVDLGIVEEVTRLDLLALDWQHVPAGFRVEVSRDGTTWRSVVAVSRYWGPLFVSEHHPFLKVRRGRVQAVFPAVPARFLRLVQTGAVRHRGWAARELFVYGPGPAPPPAPPPGEITAALRRERVELVYANHWLSAVVAVESDGAVRVQESNLYPNSYGGRRPSPERLAPFVARPGRGILIGSDGDAAAVRTLLEAQGIRVRASAAGPYGLLVLEGRLARRDRRARGCRERHRRLGGHGVGGRARRGALHARPRVGPARQPRAPGSRAGGPRGARPARRGIDRRDALAAARAGPVGRATLLVRIGAPRRRSPRGHVDVSGKPGPLSPADAGGGRQPPVDGRGDRVLRVTRQA